MNKMIALVACATVLSSCGDLPQVDRTDDGTGYNRWQLANIFGTGGDGQGVERQQGRVTGGQRVEAGQGTIFPGRQPLLIDSDFVDENGERTVSLNLVNVDIESAAA
ncbi:MAG: hypothetical protein AAFY14_13180, partial [Pseudomonadota bacterium]